MPIKGLHDESMALDRYVAVICQEAESEYRLYLAGKRRRH
jgi:hypothetical protein